MAKLEQMGMVPEGEQDYTDQSVEKYKGDPGESMGGDDLLKMDKIVSEELDEKETVPGISKRQEIAREEAIEISEAGKFFVEYGKSYEQMFKDAQAGREDWYTRNMRSWSIPGDEYNQYVVDFFDKNPAYNKTEEYDENGKLNITYTYNPEYGVQPMGAYNEMAYTNRYLDELYGKKIEEIAKVTNQTPEQVKDYMSYSLFESGVIDAKNYLNKLIDKLQADYLQ